MTLQTSPRLLGAHVDEHGSSSFEVWAPAAEKVELHIVAPDDARIAMKPGERGYFSARVDRLPAGARYFLRLDDGPDRPDPASRAQPDGVHGPSEVVPTDFAWSDDDWKGLPLESCIIYELHVGTFTPRGTFDAIVPRLPDLVNLGITALELLPVAQFPGERNWGYDGVFPFAVQTSYGGAAGLKRLVDACHRHGIAVVLDVVYNHIGPEGNCLPEFGPYFTGRYCTPWGPAVNFDGAYSDEVRRYFIANALQWIDEFHIDALRLDAVHAMIDTSARPFLRELVDAVRERARERGRTVLLIAESDLGDPRIVRSTGQGGVGLDAQWADDFHHALHTVLTGECQGYYEDFGTLENLCRAFRTGYVYTGQYSCARKRRHGAPPDGVRPAQLVVASQNHDQIGNRLEGERLSTLLSFEQEKLAAAAVLLSPFTPLLFMGQEYGERAPFPYFVSHSDPELVEAVRNGRRDEFSAFAWAADPPDPLSRDTFRSAILDWSRREAPGHAALLEVYRTLLALRREHRALTSFERITAEVVEGGAIVVRRHGRHGDALLALDLAGNGASFDTGPDQWRVRFDSAAPQWDGPGDVRPAMVAGGIQLRPYSAVLLTR